MTYKPAANDHVAPEGEAPVAAAAPELVPAERDQPPLGGRRRIQGQALCACWPRWKISAAAPKKEVNDARQYGIAGFARDVLAVADNMHRALATLDEEVRERRRRQRLMSLIEGVELTERELLKTLEKNGVKKFTPQGGEVRSRSASGDVRSAAFGRAGRSCRAGHSVAATLIGERMLRPALVGVSKPAAKPASASASN